MTAHSTKSYDHILMDCSASLAVVTYSCTWGTFLKGGSKGSWDPFDSFILFFFSSCDTLAVKMKVLLCFYCYALTFIDFYKLNNFFSSSLLALPFLLLLFAHPPFFSSLAITLDQTWSHLFVTHTNAFFPSISGRTHLADINQVKRSKQISITVFFHWLLTCLGLPTSVSCFSTAKVICNRLMGWTYSQHWIRAEHEWVTGCVCARAKEGEGRNKCSAGKEKPQHTQTLRFKWCILEQVGVMMMHTDTRIHVYFIQSQYIREWRSIIVNEGHRSWLSGLCMCREWHLPICHCYNL